MERKPCPMRSKLLLFVLLTLMSWPSSAQFVMLTHFTGTAMYGSRAITVTSTGSTATITNPCLGLPVQYHSGPGGGGSYNYSTSAPVYAIKVDAHGLNSGPFAASESLQMFVNGLAYTLTAADMLSYNNCGSAGAPPSYLSGGILYGPLGPFSWSVHNAGILQINLCTGINSFRVYSNGVAGGVAYHISIDTVPPPGCVLTATNNGPLCAGDTLKLFASGVTGASYLWTGPASFTSTLQNPVIPNATLMNAGVYTVVQTIGTTTLSATTTVVITGPPTVTAGSNSPLCEGDTLRLTASPYITGELFAWSGPAAFTSALQNPLRNSVILAHAGTYTLIASIGSCRDTAVTTVVINPSPALTLTNNGPLCAGNQLDLIASPPAPGVTFGWTGPNGFTSGANAPTISAATPLASGIYTVTATLGSCSRTAYTTVIIKPLPNVTAGSNSPLCAGQNLLLTVNPPIVGGGFQWAGPSSFSSAVQNPARDNITIGSGGVYTVVAGLNGCYDTATVTVIVKANPALTASSNSPLCQGQDLTFTSEPTEAGRTFNWIGPAMFSSNLQNPVIHSASAAASGNYYVTVTVNGCSSMVVVPVNVVHIVQPLGDTTICTDRPIALNISVDAPAGGSVLWSTGDTKEMITITNAGRYWIEVSYFDCTASDTMNVLGEVCDCKLVLPNAFTPNRDNHNDRYGPIIPNGCTVAQYTFAIYNRWGQRVFFTHDETQKWDGIFGGEPAEMGVYMYYMRYIGGTKGSPQMLKGDVSLVR